jgi:hypothetical protein
MHYIELTTTKFARKIQSTIKQTKLKMYGKFAFSQFLWYWDFVWLFVSCTCTGKFTLQMGSRNLCLQPRSSRPMNFLFHNLRVPESKCRKSDADSEKCHRKPHRKPFLCICAENVYSQLNSTKGKCTSHICGGRLPWCHSCSQDPLDWWSLLHVNIERLKITEV